MKEHKCKKCGEKVWRAPVAKSGKFILLNLGKEDLYDRGRVRLVRGTRGVEAVIFKGSMEAALMLDSFDEKIYVAHTETCHGG